METLHLLGVKNIFTTDKTKCNIFVHTLIDHLFAKLRLSDHEIKIILRAQVHTEASEKFRNCIEWVQKRLYFFPYAAHSTPHELKEMLQKLKPAHVIPISLLANDSTYAEQFVMNITNAWAEKLPIGFVKRTSEEDKLYFWKNVGKMKRVLQSDNFYHSKQSSIIDSQEMPTKQNENKTVGKRKMPQDNVDKTKLYTNCDKTVNTCEEVSREANSEHEWNFQSERDESRTVVHQTSGGTSDADYKNDSILQTKKVTHVTTNGIKKSMSIVSSYQVSNNTRQRRQHKALNEAKLKELCLTSKCFVQVTNISSKIDYFNYLGLKPT